MVLAGGVSFAGGFEGGGVLLAGWVETGPFFGASSSGAGGFSSGFSAEAAFWPGGLSPCGCCAVFGASTFSAGSVSSLSGVGMGCTAVRMPVPSFGSGRFFSSAKLSVTLGNFSGAKSSLSSLSERSEHSLYADSSRLLATASS